MESDGLSSQDSEEAADRGSLFAASESGASELLEFQPVYVLSLLRTPGYIAAERDLRGMAIPSLQQEDRLRRQRALTDVRRTFVFLMTEAALLWRVGTTDIMREQIDHIVRVSTLPNVTVGILPARVPLPVVAGHAFHIYDRQRLVVGLRHTLLVSDEAPTVRDYVDLFRVLMESSMTNDDGRAEVLRIKSDYYSD